jgi:hypothetical protein
MRTPKKTRRFEVWLDVNVCGKEASSEIIEMPADATDEECQEACLDCLDTMIENELDTGWREIPPDEVEE